MSKNLATEVLSFINEPEPVAEVWETPLPLRQASSPPDFPCDALPLWLGRFVAAESEATQTPAGLAGGLALAACAAAVAKKFEIQARPGWFEPVNIYVAGVLPPGSRKSQVFKDVIKPLLEFEHAEVEASRAAVAQDESEYRRLKKRLDGLESGFASAKNKEAADRLKLEADEMARELAQKEVIKLPRYIAQDVTPEAVARMMADSNGRLAAFSAEGELLEIMAGRYSNAPNIEIFLKGHAGDMVRVDRQSKESKSIYIKRPALTLGLCFQPSMLTDLARVKGFTGRGLLARFLWVVPDSNIGRRKTKPAAVPLSISSDYSAGIEKLCQISLGEDEDGQACVLTLDSGAAQMLDALMEQVEKALGDSEQMGAYPEWGAKFVGAVVRIAGILHVAKEPGALSTALEPISRETFLQAVQIGDFFHEHAKIAFGLMGTDAAVGDAEYILRWLKGREVSRIQKKEVFRSLRGRFRKAADMDEPLKLLMEFGWLREVKEPAEGTHKPRTFYEVNPKSYT